MHIMGKLRGFKKKNVVPKSVYCIFLLLTLLIRLPFLVMLKSRVCCTIELFLCGLRFIWIQSSIELG